MNIIAGVIFIYSSYGGYVLDFAEKLEMVNSENYEVRILGPCYSACTVMLGARKLCVSKDANFAFHAALSPKPEMARYATEYMYDHYPEWVQRYLDERGGLTNIPIYMSYDYVKKYVSTCSNDSEPIS